MAWAANPAPASRMMERVGTFWVATEEVTQVIDFVGAPVRSWALTGGGRRAFYREIAGTKQQ
jgi:hypothetical protein